MASSDCKDCGSGKYLDAEGSTSSLQCKNVSFGQSER